jgi:hypothetical protein
MFEIQTKEKGIVSSSYLRDSTVSKIVHSKYMGISKPHIFSTTVKVRKVISHYIGIGIISFKLSSGIEFYMREEF